MPNRVDTYTLQSYQRSLDHVYELSRALISSAPTWQAGLYESLRACYTEMSTHPESLRLHFIETAHAPAVQQIRRAHRTRLLAQLDELRDDAPAAAQAEALLSMIHAMIRNQIVRRQQPPDLDTAEHTFATLLFNYETPQPAR